MRIFKAVLVLALCLTATALWAAPEDDAKIRALVTGGQADSPSSPEPEQQQPPAAAPDEPVIPADASQQERLKTIVNLSFTNANLKNVLSSLAKIYGLNIVADESVNGTVTLTLRGVTLEEGLKQVLKLNGFGYIVKGEIIEVSKLELKRAAGVLAVNYINLDTALQFLQPLASQGSVLKVDETSNGILVSDYQSRIEDMRALLKEIDQPPQQVFIESKLMDVTHTDLDNLGVKVSALTKVFPLTRNVSPLTLSGGAVSLAGPSSDLTNSEIALTLTRGNDTMTAALNLLIQQKKVKVIANPTILTMNNVEARIIIGEKFPIQEQTQTTTGTLQTTRFVDVGTALRVTPRINPAGDVQLHLHPEVSSVSATLTAGPRITTREADTYVIVRDGQPIVIGGLLQQDQTLIKGRVPILGHIPFFGILFQNRADTHDQKELVIVITPHIVKSSPEGWKEPSTDAHEVATRLDVSDLYQRAVALEDPTTLFARQVPEALRDLKAVDLYQKLVDRFPTHPYAMEALWRMGFLAKEKLYDLDRAETALKRLLTQFPKTEYRNPALRQLKEISWLRQQGSQREIKVTAVVEKTPQTNFGSR